MRDELAKLGESACASALKSIVAADFHTLLEPDRGAAGLVARTPRTIALRP